MSARGDEVKVGGDTYSAFTKGILNSQRGERDSRGKTTGRRVKRQLDENTGRFGGEKNPKRDRVK